MFAGKSINLYISKQFKFFNHEKGIRFIVGLVSILNPTYNATTQKKPGSKEIY